MKRVLRPFTGLKYINRFAQFEIRLSLVKPRTRIFLQSGVYPYPQSIKTRFRIQKIAVLHPLPAELVIIVHVSIFGLGSDFNRRNFLAIANSAMSLLF